MSEQTNHQPVSTVADPQRTAAAVQAAVTTWLEQLADEPPETRPDGGSLWRLSWGCIDPHTGERSVRLVRIGRERRHFDAAFGHVWVPDAYRSNPRWLHAEAGDVLGGYLPDPIPADWDETGPDDRRPALHQAQRSPALQLQGEVVASRSHRRTSGRHRAAAPAQRGPLHASSLLRPVSRVDTSPAREGWRGAAALLTGGLLRLPPGSAEAAVRAGRASVQRSLGRPVTIVFANPKGGAGKTPATLLAAATFGTQRGGGVVAWDCNETHGTLGLRGLPDGPATVWDLLGHLDDFERVDARLGDLTAYMRGQGDARFDVLASGEDPANMAQVDAPACRRILDVLQRYYKIVCVDTGNNMLAPNWRAVMASADQLVVCSNYEQDRAYTAASMLDHLEAAGQHRLVEGAVTVLSGARPSADARARVEDHFTARTRAVVHIPADPGIAADTVEYGALAEATRRAWMQACAVIADGLASPPSDR